MMQGLTDGDVLSVIFRLVIAPLVGYLFYYVFVKQQKSIDDLKEKQSKIEQSHAIVVVMVENIKEDIKEIKYGIEKMLDRRQYHKYEKSPRA
jgi:Tfp pilus assembly protein PilO